MPDRLPLSSMLGTAILGTPRLAIQIAADFGGPAVNDSTRDEQANFGWPMVDPEPLVPIIPMPGHQGFWNWRQVP